ncbi:hypothetical protein [Homoserinibacter gongjuensis]|uniref:hypothetical protein n=1 Tax=Homoserinibacter gongjuensis TaxID=1162968 RepID=UPI0024E13DB2|nr:hypothetical protein [Homoserinibacter gongjuensis]
MFQQRHEIVEQIGCGDPDAVVERRVPVPAQIDGDDVMPGRSERLDLGAYMPRSTPAPCTSTSGRFGPSTSR